ncbi:MAG: hypothetical protein JXB05_33590 [Myxococcaceae bacterium]|nr:hypothetical protein [Myxococcaceae bacterium]
MKTFTVALLFTLSLFTLFTAARADALGHPRIEKGMSQPHPLAEGDDDKDDDKDDEGDEEDYRGLSQRAALELVDPGGLDDVLRLRIAARHGP